MRLRRPVPGTAAEAFAATARPADGVGWREAEWCAVDLEMTGLDPRRDEIVAIGAVPIQDGRIRLGGGMYTLVRAAKRSEVGAVLVHKLRLADVADAPSLEDGIDCARISPLMRDHLRDVFRAVTSVQRRLTT